MFHPCPCNVTFMQGVFFRFLADICLFEPPDCLKKPITPVPWRKFDICYLIFDILANPPNLSTIPYSLENIKLTSHLIFFPGLIKPHTFHPRKPISAPRNPWQIYRFIFCEFRLLLQYSCNWHICKQMTATSALYISVRNRFGTPLRHIEYWKTNSRKTKKLAQAWIV